MIKFSDLQSKIESCISIVSKVNQASILSQLNAGVKNPIAPLSEKSAMASVINAHGRFYGLRSKYDGNGNKRTPVKS